MTQNGGQLFYKPGLNESSKAEFNQLRRAWNTKPVPGSHTNSIAMLDCFLNTVTAFEEHEMPHGFQANDDPSSGSDWRNEILALYGERFGKVLSSIRKAIHQEDNGNDNSINTEIWHVRNNQSRVWKHDTFLMPVYHSHGVRYTLTVDNLKGNQVNKLPGATVDELLFIPAGTKVLFSWSAEIPDFQLVYIVGEVGGASDE